eukprot:TRINITY_DN1871_c0_g1_i3.p1 TRINITY_DN1871_c0_g1~~TRINITY_DN1871_c0_g1_i3.p1  ORF type:complete len:585 (+),score=87.29 TRINITY_DN1871_c0_g1_i3:239-1756(+)
MAAIQQFGINLCISHKIELPDVCESIVPEFVPEVLAVVDIKFLTPSVTCEFLGVCANNQSFKPPQVQMSFPKPKPPVKHAVADPNGAQLRILHLTDLHFDSQYSEGAVVDCGRPLCCRSLYGEGNGTNAAPKWGSYHCDANILLVHALLEQVQKLQPQPDFIIWTGDLPPHDVWIESQDTQLTAARLLADAFKTYLPNATILPAMGNHEGFPVNSFPAPPANSWLYDGLAAQWSQWLDADALQTLRYGGYYEMRPRAGLRVLSVNMNYCNNGNYWLFLNSTDPAEMLQWMIDRLQAAEDAGDKVYVLGHIPPGEGNCLMTWGARYEQVINRYENTIIAQFMGHTHRDHFEVMYEANTTRPTNVVLIAPSLTPYTHINPSFRIIVVDANSYALVDYIQYHTNLDDAAMHDYPLFSPIYTAVSEYGLKDMSAASWDALGRASFTNATVFTMLYDNYQTRYDVQTCVDQCAKVFSCSLLSGSFGVMLQCMGGAWDFTSIVEVLEDALC